MLLEGAVDKCCTLPDMENVIKGYHEFHTQNLLTYSCVQFTVINLIGLLFSQGHAVAQLVESVR